MTERSLWTMYFPALLIASLVLYGCGTQLQILTFNYAIRSFPDSSALIKSVQSGQTTVASLLSIDPCNFTADFSGTQPPELVTSGTPGQTGFNVNILSTKPISIPVTTNPPSCVALEEFEITIGGPSQALALGMLTNLTNARVWFLNGDRFPTSQFFEARVRSFDPANSRSDGQFRFINRSTAASDTVLIVEGSYAITP